MENEEMGEKMRVMVCSDSHGRRDLLKKAAGKFPVDIILHLGDNERDARALAEEIDIPVEYVSGNCDFGGVGEKIIELEGKRILMTHGHHYGVKSSLFPLRTKMRETGAHIALYGHTHIPEYEFYGKGLILNPGAVCGNRTDRKASFAYLEWQRGGQIYVQMMEVNEND